MDVASVTGTFVGVALSAVGIWVAFLAKRAAGGARAAAEAARQAVKRSLTGIDAGRAIGLIERIQTLNQQRKWEATTHMYKDLRAMLSDLQESQPEQENEIVTKLRRAREQVRTLEDALETLADTSEPGSLLAEANRQLTEIHEIMLTIQSQSRVGQESF